MSRNLCQTYCERCKTEPVRLVERSRPITKKEAEVYFEEFKGLLVADAYCPNCNARYLAWCKDPLSLRAPDYDMDYFDLSYRSTFNDEPGPDDLPKPDVLERLDRIIKKQTSATDRHNLVVCRNQFARMLGYLEDKL
jgi:hypothetical protein